MTDTLDAPDEDFAAYWMEQNGLDSSDPVAVQQVRDDIQSGAITVGSDETDEWYESIGHPQDRYAVT